jgi:hypothetical protein
VSLFRAAEAIQLGFSGFGGQESSSPDIRFWAALNAVSV